MVINPNCFLFLLSRFFLPPNLFSSSFYLLFVFFLFVSFFSPFLYIFLLIINLENGSHFSLLMLFSLHSLLLFLFINFCFVSYTPNCSSILFQSSSILFNPLAFSFPIFLQFLSSTYFIYY